MLVGCKAEMSLFSTHFQVETHHNNYRKNGTVYQLLMSQEAETFKVSSRFSEGINSVPETFILPDGLNRCLFFHSSAFFDHFSHFRRTKGWYEGKSLIFQRGESRPRYYFRCTWNKKQEVGVTHSTRFCGTTHKSCRATHHEHAHVHREVLVLIAIEKKKNQAGSN